MKQNLTFEDLEGALMLISFDTVDEDGVVERETLAYTYAKGKLNYYTIDADGVLFDASFDPADHEIAKITTYDFDTDDYENATDLVKAILKHEGKEIIKEAPANEWEIVDNKVDIVVYDAERQRVAEHSWKSRAKKVAPKEPEMTEKEKEYKPLKKDSVMALVISKKPAILLGNDDDYRTVIFEGKTITKSLFADIENCAEFTKVTIPGNVEGIAGDAFEDFANLREAEILGYVEGVERSLGAVATLDIDWENPAELAEHLKSGCYIEVKRRRIWRDWN